jgi:hypothetical protein
VTAGVLEEHRAVGRGEAKDQRTAVATIALLLCQQVLDGNRVQLGGQVLHEFGEARLLLLPGHAEFADADLAGLIHLAVRPDAAVLARVNVDEHVVAEIDPFATQII